MESLQRITHHINIFVRFFQSINCLFLNLGWLERNIVHGSTEKVVLTLLLVAVAGVFTFGCSGALGRGANLCSSENSGYLVLLLVVGIIGYFFYKRFNQGQGQGNQGQGNQGHGANYIPSASIVQGDGMDEGEKLIREATPPAPASVYREMEMGQLLAKRDWRS
jgi:hypothetical protein